MCLSKLREAGSFQVFRPLPNHTIYTVYTLTGLSGEPDVYVLYTVCVCIYVNSMSVVKFPDLKPVRSSPLIILLMFLPS